MRVWRWWMLIVPCVAPSRARAQDTVPGDALAVAAREVRSGLAPRVVDIGGATVFPYGHGEAALTCAERRVCVVGLESGERIVGTTVGDSERWLATVVSSGAIPIVALKPTMCGTTSDLVVVTDRRVYTLRLTAAPCVARGARVTPYVRFWYPDVAPPAVQPPLAFTYHWTHDPHIAWTPTAVYDDGTRVFIRLPAVSREEGAPVLWQETGDGDRVLLNYTIDSDAGGGVYVTDRVFARAILEERDGRRVRRVEIVNDRLWSGTK
jgi:type IV secretion system protein TrbG